MELRKKRPNKSLQVNGRGVLPNIRVPVYPRVDLESSRDSALKRALEVLGRHSEAVCGSEFSELIPD